MYYSHTKTFSSECVNASKSPGKFKQIAGNISVSTANLQFVRIQQLSKNRIRFLNDTRNQGCHFAENDII